MSGSSDPVVDEVVCVDEPAGGADAAVPRVGVEHALHALDEVGAVAASMS